MSGIAIQFCLLGIFYFLIIAHSLELSPKMSLISVDSSRSNIFKNPVDVFHPSEENSKSSEKLYKKAVLIKQNDDDRNENVVCKHDMCVVTVDSKVSDKKTKTNTISTDVHVVVSSGVNVDNESDDKKNNDNGEVPVYKGYNGVKFEDVNWRDDTNQEAPKNENEESSSVITSPYNGEKIIINQGNAPLKPNARLVPPPRVDWNERYPQNENRGVRIPSGWTSNWKPSNPPPGDFYHYNVQGDRKDFAGQQPTYRNVCKCTREPIYPGRSDFYPTRPSNPWYPVETTTKPFVDDKLSPPFSVIQKRFFN